MKYLIMFLWFLICLFIFPWMLCIADIIFGTHLSCKMFKWHNGKGKLRTFDGCSFHSACSKCGRGVMQDSQGNWF